MKEFKKWLKLTQDGWVKDVDGKMWPGFGGLSTQKEVEAAEDGWRAALKMELADLKAARDGFDLGLHDTIYEELNGTSEKK